MHAFFDRPDLLRVPQNLTTPLKAKMEVFTEGLLWDGENLMDAIASRPSMGIQIALQSILAIEEHLTPIDEDLKSGNALPSALTFVGNLQNNVGMIFHYSLIWSIDQENVSDEEKIALYDVFAGLRRVQVLFASIENWAITPDGVREAKTDIMKWLSDQPDQVEAASDLVARVRIDQLIIIGTFGAGKYTITTTYADSSTPAYIELTVNDNSKENDLSDAIDAMAPAYLYDGVITITHTAEYDAPKVFGYVFLDGKARAMSKNEWVGVEDRPVGTPTDAPQL